MAETGKHIVLGITGGIAAYKSQTLIQLFKSHGYEVRVTATRHALEFVTPLTIETLSQNKLYSELFDPTEHRDVQHISMADWADCVVVAPATANILAKMAHGIADDLLSSTLLATKAPVVVAPAMNDGMWENPATQANLAALASRGVRVVSPGTGELACGTSGTGRMAEPSEILSACPTP